MRPQPTTRQRQSINARSCARMAANRAPSAVSSALRHKKSSFCIKSWTQKRSRPAGGICGPQKISRAPGCRCVSSWPSPKGFSASSHLIGLLSSTQSASAALSRGAETTPSKPDLSNPTARASSPRARKRRARCAARRSPPATRKSISTATFPMRHRMRRKRTGCKKRPRHLAGALQSADKACKRENCSDKIEIRNNFRLLRQLHLRPAVTYVHVSPLGCKFASLSCRLLHPSGSLLTLSTS